MKEEARRPETGRKPRRKYEKPAVRTARFAENRALACLKREGDGQMGCGPGFFS